MSDYAPYIKALERCERRVAELELELIQLKCQHEWQEQPGEPPVDCCFKCGKVRE